uniref:PTS sugar transporter subunit IIA n=1 Tax=Ndongobacter massiliensis TaxID=1871025 RepID=UPI0009303F58|nr:PTS sugar transporter subunit IIA [Ndongobacter massiliensis]
MVGLITVTHGDFGRELAKSAELIVGESKYVTSIGLHLGDTLETLTKEIVDAVRKMHEQTNEGVLILIDLFGGTTSNAAAQATYQLEAEVPIYCLTGLNLPMYLEIIMQREFSTLSELVKIGKEVGEKSVVSLHEKIGI